MNKKTKSRYETPAAVCIALTADTDILGDSAESDADMTDLYNEQWEKYRSNTQT